MGYLVAYVVLAVMVGFLGRRRSIGFWGFFTISLFITPLLTFFILVLTMPREKPRRRYPAS